VAGKLRPSAVIGSGTVRRVNIGDFVAGRSGFNEVEGVQNPRRFFAKAAERGLSYDFANILFRFGGGGIRHRRDKIAVAEVEDCDFLRPVGQGDYRFVGVGGVGGKAAELSDDIVPYILLRAEYFRINGEKPGNGDISGIRFCPEREREDVEGHYEYTGGDVNAPDFNGGVEHKE